MISKEIFQSDFGKEIWRKYFSFLEEPEEEPLKLSPYQPIAGNQSLSSNKQEPHLENVVEAQINEGDRGLGDVSNQSEGYRPEDFDRVFNNSNQQNRRTVFENQRNVPTLYDIVRFYRNKDVVGEESLVTAITLAAANDISFGVEGFSGSGKTFIVDKLMKLLPQEWIYKVELSSKLAVFYDSEKINDCKTIYIPELQKAMQDKKSPIIEVIKNLTEGKDATRIVTRGDKKGSVEYSIKKGISIIYTLALENYFKKDEESSRRFMRLKTDSSKKHLDEIHAYKARKRFSVAPDYHKAESLKSKLRQHITGIANMQDIKVLDPCADYFKELIPKTQKSVGYVDHYYNLVDACVKFHYADRENFEVEGVNYIVANVEDHFNVFNIYFREFTQALRDFAERMEEGDEKEEALAELVEVKDPNWTECLQKSQQLLLTDPSLEAVREAIPTLPDSWYARQCHDALISTLDYKTGKPIIIANLSAPRPADEHHEPALSYVI